MARDLRRRDPRASRRRAPSTTNARRRSARPTGSTTVPGSRRARGAGTAASRSTASPRPSASSGRSASRTTTARAASCWPSSRPSSSPTSTSRRAAASIATTAGSSTSSASPSGSFAPSTRSGVATGKGAVVMGDFNIAPTPIDLARPRGNETHERLPARGARRLRPHPRERLGRHLPHAQPGRRPLLVVEPAPRRPRPQHRLADRPRAGLRGSPAARPRRAHLGSRARLGSLSRRHRPRRVTATLDRLDGRARARRRR